MIALARSALSGRATRWSNCASGCRKIEPCWEKSSLPERPCLTAAGRQIRFDFILHRQKPAVGMTQEHQSHNRQKVFVAGIIRVGAQRIRRTPKPLFNRFDMFQLCHTHSVRVFLWYQGSSRRVYEIA